ncbi:MAG: rhodanese-like domain-containing protein [Ignavibacteriales bacterium]
MGLLGKIFGSKESKQEQKEEKLIVAEEKPVETVGALESESIEERPVETMESEPIREDKSEPAEKEEEPKELAESVGWKSAEIMQSEPMEEKSGPIKEKHEPMENEPKPVEMAPEPPESSAPHEEERDPFINLDGEEVISGIIAERFQVLDVRTPREYEFRRIPGSTLIPLQQLDSRYAELDPSREILVVCEHGIRSQDACLFLSEMGFKRLYHLVGGLSAYRGPQEGKMFK